MGIVDNALIGASGNQGYNLQRSLRFRSSASAYLNRTPASAGNRKTWTWSGWVKRGSLSSAQAVFSAWDNSANQQGAIRFEADNTIRLYTGGTTGNLGDAYTVAVFRDPSAWYHIVGVIDTTQATAANRIKLYVNGVQQSLTIGTTAPQNMDGQVNATIVHRTGSLSGSSYFDGYLTEVNFIDGQALTPSSFGSTNALTGVWQPARYTGTYGTNGFYLPFTDNSGATATTIGKDFSGNSNNWTPNNISVTAGVTYDSMTDVPTLTSATAANFAVMNVLNGNPANGSLSDGNLTGLSSSAGEGYWNSTIAIPSSGKWYWEFQFTTGGNGIRTAVTTTSMGTYSLLLNESGRLYVNGADQGIVASGYSSTDIMGVSVDVSTTTIKWYKNNTLNYTYTYTAQSLPLFAFGGKYSNPCYFNFGQRPFAYTPPTGFVALNTYNLPTSTIVKGNTVMDATLYSGNGTSTGNTQVITNTAGFKPDLVWIKARNSSTPFHILNDSVRGTNKILYSNSTNTENSVSNVFNSFNSNGFTVDYNSGFSETVTNASGQTYVGWQWQAGQGTSSSNTNGTITSTVSVNASAGFSIATYTGTGANATVGHGLGVAPSMIIIKSRSGTTGWLVYHQSLGNTNYLILNATDASAAASAAWNNTSPTSSVFTIGNASFVNVNGATHVAYCWTPIAGFSAFGSYTGNGSADGPFIYTGFQPKWVLIKASSTTSQWVLWDTARNTYNVTNSILYPNLSAAEASFSIDILSNGFKFRESGGAGNDSGVTYIYAAFATSPFRNSLAR